MDTTDFNNSDADHPATPTEATVHGDTYEVATADGPEAALDAICAGLVVRLHGLNMADLVGVALRDGIEIECCEVEVWTVPEHREDTTRKIESFVGVRERRLIPARVSAKAVLASHLETMKTVVKRAPRESETVEISAIDWDDKTEPGPSIVYSPPKCPANDSALTVVDMPAVGGE